MRRADSKHMGTLLNNTCSTGCSAVTPKGPRCSPNWHCPIGSWENESVVMGADAMDLATHAFKNAYPPMDYYGSTPWYQPLGAGFGIYWMAATRFWHWGSAVTGTYDIALASSRDGRNFTFVERSAWLSPGLDGSRGSRRLWFAPPGPVRVGDEELYFVTRANTDEYSGESLPSCLSFPLSSAPGTPLPPTPPSSSSLLLLPLLLLSLSLPSSPVVCRDQSSTGPSIDPKSPHGEWEAEIGVGRLRLNGLVSLDAPYTDPAGAAVLTTKPIVYQGSKLLINLDAGGGGSLFVQVYRPNKTEPLLTSNFLVHNGVDLEVAFVSGAAWGGGRVANKTAVADLAGTPVVLVLRMQDCKLYGLRFANK